MLRPTDQNKNLSARIAARVNAASRLEVLPQCFEGLLQGDAPAHLHSIVEGAVDANVGIWVPQPEPNGMAYVRGAKDTQSSLWADVERIEPKGRRKRIVLLGESVARGYFYDPEFNPAMALRSILENAAGIDAIEIIDLACIDQSADELLFLAKSALRLQPDAYVVFAGNNWHPRRGFAPIATEEIARALRWTRDWNSVIALIQERTSESASRILRALGDLSRHHNLPIIFLLPEFNLADWRPEFTGPNLFRTPETARAWRTARAAAEEALQDGGGEGVAPLARQMMELADGTDPIGPNLLARCLFSEGRMEEARKLFELARDMSLSLPGIRSPRCYSVVQETLRKTAPKEGITLVDLPKQFSEHLGGGLPDRRLFHDYCHLTVEGTIVAMSSAAEHLLRILDCQQSWHRLKDVPIQVAPATLAQAHLLAAVHNATWGQGPDIIHYHCSNALRLMPELAKTMRFYLDACAKQAPTQLCSAFQQFIRSSGPAISRYFALLHPGSIKDLNLVLVDSMVDVLEPLQPGTRHAVNEMLLMEHGLQGTGKDLLQPCCASQSMGEYKFRNQNGRGYYQSLEITSPFRFFCGKSQALDFRLVCRLTRQTASGETLTVVVNGCSLLQDRLGQQWHAMQGRIPPSMIQPGINSIVIRWPETCQPWSDRAHEIADQFDLNVAPTLFDVYGEIHSFQICRAA